MRIALSLLALSVFGWASADWLIGIPIGRKIPYRQVKVDFLSELSRSRSLERRIGVGITPELEVDYHGERLNGGTLRDTLDAQYNFIAPFTGTAPGISFGILDALNRTADGRRVYAVVTFRNAVDNIGNGNLPLDVSLGVSQGDRARAFVGVSLPLSDNLRAQVEHDGFRLSSAIEYRLFDNALGARIAVRETDVLVGANFTLRF